MYLEQITTMPPIATVSRDKLIDACLAAVSQREEAYIGTAAAGDAAAAETNVLKAFFNVMVTRLTALAAIQDAVV